MQFYDFKEIEERVILIGVQTEQDEDVAASLDELEELAATAGAVTVGKVIQNREAVHPGTYIGKGKIEEVAALLAAYDANGVICDDELSPAQMNNLERELDCKVMDRTLLILDIFAQRARTKEGRLQVELAQYKYLLPRLTGMWGHLVRQTASGGKSPIGTRGPGETQLETDRRHIRRKIAKLTEDLEEVRRIRAVQRDRREKNEIPVVAIVGYTNAGKSTLLNALTHAGIPARNRLFDTLDTTTRTLEISDTCTVLISDTVGFIRKLPRNLVEAFKSTLEEAKYADYIIHVVDASNPQAELQMHTVYETLRELGATGKKIITLLNKQDQVQGEALRDFRADYTVKCSARTGEGLEELKDVLAKLLAESQIYLEELYTYKEAGKIQIIREYGSLLSEEYREDGIFVKARVPAEIFVSVMPKSHK